MLNRKSARLDAMLALAVLALIGLEEATAANLDPVTVIRGGTIYDGSGKPPYVGDVVIKGDLILYVGRHRAGKGRVEIDAGGKAVAPGFINMLAHPEESLLVDGRALSDLTQGVTLEVLGEDSMGPLTEAMKALAVKRQSDLRYPIDWTTLGQYLETLQRHGIALNVASFIGAGTVRVNVLGEDDVQPTAAQLDRMRTLVRQGMEEGALGLTDALIYSPNGYAHTPELIALATESARCGGIYIAHIRSEGDRVMEAVQETIDIARASGGPAEIYHLKLAGKSNWPKLESVLDAIETARHSGIRITADMYTYTAGSTGLDAAMPPWVQSGGVETWIDRLRQPALRARVVADMRDPQPRWENLYLRAGAAGTLLLAFKNPALRPLIGHTLQDVAHARGISPEDAAIDLVIENGARVEVAYFLMSEDNLRRQISRPWVSFGSDAAAPAPEGIFLKSSIHPRAYGNFSRLLAKYVRDEKVLTLQEAVRRLTTLPADNLSLQQRGALKAGYFADVVIFDPARIQDHATFENPHQLSTGVEYVWVNGTAVLRAGSPTGSPAGRVVRGRGWKDVPGGGCRPTSRDWTWSHP